MDPAPIQAPISAAQRFPQKLAPAAFRPEARKSGTVLHRSARMLTAALLLAATAGLTHGAPSFPDTLETEHGPLEKLGEHRYTYRFFFDVYDAALYAAPGAVSKDILRADTRFRLHFHYLRKVDRSIVLESANKALDRNLSDKESDSIADRVRRFHQATETVRKGDESSMDYVPGRGTTLRVNGDPKVMIEGRDFARLYFRIWFGDDPLSEDLKNDLLGR